MKDGKQCKGRSTKQSIKSRRLKLVQYCIQLTMSKNENFSKTAVTFLQDNCLDLLRCAFLHKLSGCMRNIIAFCQHLLRLIKSAILADTNKTQISADNISQANISVYLYFQHFID